MDKAKEYLDIEYELNLLIFKYEIDMCIPKYRKYINAFEISKNIYDEFRIQNQEIVLISENKTDLEWFQIYICKENETHVIYNEENIPFENDVVYINLSFWREEEITLALLKKDANVISIYKEFEKNKLYFESPFYDIYSREYYVYEGGERRRDWDSFDINACFFKHRRMYELSINDVEERRYYLEKIIFDCVYAKDFLTLKKYINEADSENKIRYELFYAEVVSLFQKIKKELEKRPDDILMIWLDCLEYGEDKRMEFFKELDKDAVVFTNAYTVTPYTGPTFKTIFGGKRIIEEEGFRINEIKDSESEFFQVLNEQEYQFKYYGDLNYVSREKKAAHYYNIYRTITQLYWDVVSDLLLCGEKKQFCVLHELMQTHQPYMSLGNKSDIYVGHVKHKGVQDVGGFLKELARESLVYVDDQLRFWNQFIPPKMTKIYMSDHGHTYLGRFHPILKIQNKKWNACKIEALFSYFDFSRLLIDIVLKRELTISKCEYALVQEVDFYNKKYIHDLIEYGEMAPEVRPMFGFQGVVTDKDMLVKFNHGVLQYSKHENDNVMVTDERIAYLESLLSKKVIDIEKEEKFEAARLYYAGWRRARSRQENQIQQKKDVINKIFSEISNEELFAIRGGGVHTMYLLMSLPYELRKKVKFLIDTDKQCMAAGLGIQVIAPSEIREYGIQTILISSYYYKTLWQTELKNSCSKIIDIYEEFSKSGIVCKKEFYKLSYEADDFVLSR